MYATGPVIHIMRKAVLSIGYAILLIPLVWFVSMALHEMCHFQVAEALGYNAYIQFNGLFRGTTYYYPYFETGFNGLANGAAYYQPIADQSEKFLISMAGGVGAFLIMFPIWLGVRNRVNFSLDLVIGAMTFIQLTYGFAEAYGFDQDQATIGSIMIATAAAFAIVRTISYSRRMRRQERHAVRDVPAPAPVPPAPDA